MRCGHDLPSREETSYYAKSPFPLDQEYHITLLETNEAILEMGRNSLKGTWTMVYDEGFNIEFGELNFFAFSKYAPIRNSGGKTNYESFCYSTCVGWYHNKDKTQWGCYQATKKGVNPDEITYHNTKNFMNIVDPNSISDSSLVNSFLNMNFKEKHTEITFPQNIEVDNKLKSAKFLRNSSFIAEREHMLLKLDSSFKAHSLYLNKLKLVKKSWNAEVHPNFSNLSIKELNRFAGINRQRITTEKVTPKPIIHEDVSMFPKNFDWKNKLKPAGTQGNCGSCYTYSTIRMIEARLKILYDHEVNLSIQHPLDCAFYNQGCNGGYPYLTMKFSNEFGLIPEFCKQYAVKYKFNNELNRKLI
jgi:cathepsin C